MKILEPNVWRATVGLAALICMVIGAGILWGIGGALFAGGLFVAIDASSDEVVERFTNTKRGNPPSNTVAEMEGR